MPDYPITPAGDRVVTICKTCSFMHGQHSNAKACGGAKTEQEVAVECEGCKRKWTMNVSFCMQCDVKCVCGKPWIHPAAGTAVERR